MVRRVSCSVVGCLPEKRQSCYRMPKESPKACREWLRRATNKHFNENHDITKYSVSFRICNDHFEPDCFIPDIYTKPNSSRILKKRALPTLNLLPAIGSDLPCFLSVEEYCSMDTFQTNTCSTETAPPTSESIASLIPVQSGEPFQINDSMGLKKENIEECEENMDGMKHILKDTLNELKKNNIEMKMLREEFKRNEENWKQEKLELYNRLQALEERIERQETGKTKSKVEIKGLNIESGFKTKEAASAIDEIVNLNDNRGILAKNLSKNNKPIQMEQKPKCLYTEYLCTDHDYYLQGIKRGRKKKDKNKPSEG